MYRNYFGLGETPFSIAPDPRYLYMSLPHQEALAHLLYGVNAGGGFVLLTGEIGAGKTTICRCLLEQVPPSCDIAYVFNPKLTVEELLSTICSEFRIASAPGRATTKAFVDRINTYLLDAHAKGRQSVLIIDEAQNLSTDVLEQMRLLTNLETNQRKLLQIVLIGQPELAEKLARPELRQLAQRIVARYHLGPLTQSEVAAYVGHRLEVAGARKQLFPPSILGRLYRLSHGVPRVINVLCDRALLGVYVQGRERVDRAILRQAAREVLGEPISRRRRLIGFLTRKKNSLRAAALAAVAFQKKPRGEDAKAPSTVAPSAQRAKDAVRGRAAAAAAALPQMLEWPAGEARARSKHLAYAALFRAWGAEYHGGDASFQARRQDLRCLTARGGLDELRKINHPAVLRLRDRKGGEFHATLTALDETAATFAMGDVLGFVALSVLATQWSGTYTLLWRPPVCVRDSIWPGERGPAVAWLGEQLAWLEGRVVQAPHDPVFDEAMVGEVKKFQLACGLIPDGAVGAHTLMRLSGATDPAAPRLARVHGGK
jgi:general secretion pathway protein A